MADEVWNGVRPGDPIDDDRLLAYALGLDDDPELVEAAAADAELGRRLETVRAEVDQVAAGVRAAVPAPDDDYTDLATRAGPACRSTSRRPGSGAPGAPARAAGCACSRR